MFSHFTSTLCAWTCGKWFVDEKKVRPMMTGTIVLLLYLIYPSVSTSVLGLWKCEDIDKVGPIFVVDPEILCTDTSHLVWVNALGVPSVLVYVIGLPTSAIGLLYRFRNKLNEANTRIRFGILYDGYKRENYMHEIWVVVRKLTIIVIGNIQQKTANSTLYATPFGALIGLVFGICLSFLNFFYRNKAHS